MFNRPHLIVAAIAAAIAGQYPPQIREYLLQKTRIGLTQPRTAMEAHKKPIVHAVRTERRQAVDAFSSRAFSLPAGQTLLPGDTFLTGDTFLPGDMVMPGEAFSPGSTQYPASGLAGAIRESAQRFARIQRITNCSFLVNLSVGVAATAQGVRF